MNSYEAPEASLKKRKLVLLWILKAAILEEAFHSSFIGIKKQDFWVKVTIGSTASISISKQKCVLDKRCSGFSLNKISFSTSVGHAGVSDLDLVLILHEVRFDAVGKVAIDYLRNWSERTSSSNDWFITWVAHGRFFDSLKTQRFRDARVFSAHKCCFNWRNCKFAFLSKKTWFQLFGSFGPLTGLAFSVHNGKVRKVRRTSTS